MNSSTSPVWRRGLVLAALLALALPATASAKLVYQTGVAKTSIWVAEDDGSGAQRLGPGRSPAISPDGTTVAFGDRFDAKSTPRLQVMAATGGAPRTVLTGWRFGPFAWSPDSRYIATVGGPEIGQQRLVLIEVATGAVRTIARGYFYGASFSPASDQLVYGRQASERLFARSDLEVVAVAGGAPRRLTNDGRGLYPLWGPTQIAYVRWQRPTGKEAKIDGPKYQLWLLAPDGSSRRQLTRGRIPFLLTGLIPTAWSADGSRLLAQFTGQDTLYPVTVDPATGRQRKISTNTEGLVSATGLSRDGSTILGYTQAFESTPRSNVVAIPYAGGAWQVLVRRASLPWWTR